MSFTAIKNEAVRWRWIDDFIMTLKSMSVVLRRKQKIDLICHFKKE